MIPERTTSTEMRIRAPAKVNLRLVVLAKEAGGFHQIETIFCRLALADEIVIERSSRQGITLDVIGADVGPAESNLVVRAARAWCAEAHTDPAYALTLHKQIPAGAGLGGGSSDAAATLRALDRMHEDALGVEHLLQIAATLGSDVPFFVVDAPLAVAWGRGERLMTHAGPGPAPALVAMPEVVVSTADAYDRLDNAPREGPRAACWSMRALESWAKVATLACNDFERVVLPGIPTLAPALALLRAHGALVARLTGSGSAIFAVYDLETARNAAADALARAHPDLRIFRTRACI